MSWNTNCSTHYHKDCSKSILHSPAVAWIQATREATNSKYLLNVHNTQQQDTQLKSGSAFITWYVTGSLLLPSATMEKCDLWNFSHPSHPYSTQFTIHWNYTSNYPVSLHGTYWDNFILPLPPMYLSQRSHLSGPVGSFLYIIYFPHAHYLNNVYYILWSNYVNIMRSTDNKAHYKIIYILLLTPPIGQIFSRPHFTHIKMKGISDLLMHETLNCKWYFTCNVSQNKTIFSYKPLKVHSLRFKILWYRDRLI